MANKIDRMAVTVLIFSCLGHERSTRNRHYPAILGRPDWGYLGWDNAAKTDMDGIYADREVSEGAAGVVWLALDAPKDLAGGFLRDGKLIPW